MDRTFKTGDIIKNLWMSDTNHLQKCLFVKYNSTAILVGVSKEDKLYLSHITTRDIKYMEHDEEHYVKIGHCDLVENIKSLLSNY
jgi:hypothetical protein